MTKLPVMKPDCCAECPLIGKIPQERREYGSYETLICLGTMDAMTQRQSNIRASKRDSKHPLHRYCDTRWEAWQELSGREFPIAMEVYNTFRMPFELQMQPMIRFHKRGRPRKETASQQRPTEREGGATARQQPTGRSEGAAAQQRPTEREDGAAAQQQPTGRSGDGALEGHRTEPRNEH